MVVVSPDTYFQRLRLAGLAGQFRLQVVVRDDLVRVGQFEDALLAHLQQEPELLRQLHPRRFEEVIARVIEKMGFEVNLTRYSKDGGVDIFALWHGSDVPVLLVIDCKRYAPDRPIGPSIIDRRALRWTSWPRAPRRAPQPPPRPPHPSR